MIFLKKCHQLMGEICHFRRKCTYCEEVLGGAMMEFEEKVILFLNRDEASRIGFKEYMKRKNLSLDVIDSSEIDQIHLVGRYITLSDILELEDILDSRITVCSRYIGSAETIRSLGLD